MTTGTHAAPWWRVPRSHGAVVGVLLLLLGLWGGLAPFIGPYAGYGYTPNSPWAFTWGRLWLEVVPAVVTLLAGLALLFSGNRVTGVWMSWLAVLAGAWFVIGGPVSRLWHGTSQAGTPTGSVFTQVFEQIGLFLGLGVVIVFLGGAALTRFAFTTARPRNWRREAEPYPEATPTGRTERTEPAADDTTPAERAGAEPTSTERTGTAEPAGRVPSTDEERAR
ncbi:MAG TPA: hypothetical protein VF053_18185 [Streptosporangiales bacterium]